MTESDNSIHAVMFIYIMAYVRIRVCSYARILTCTCESIHVFFNARVCANGYARRPPTMYYLYYYNIFLLLFSAVHDISRTFDFVTP